MWQPLINEAKKIYKRKCVATYSYGVRKVLKLKNMPDMELKKVIHLKSTNQGRGYTIQRQQNSVMAGSLLMPD